MKKNLLSIAFGTCQNTDQVLDLRAALQAGMVRSSLPLGQRTKSISVLASGGLPGFKARESVVLGNENALGTTA